MYSLIKERVIIVKSYASKEELKAEIEKTYQKYIAEFDDIPEKRVIVFR